MADISAKQVMALREKTGLPMMDVKKALVAAGGDEDAAIEALRKRFADKMVTKADRVAANGRIGVFAGDTHAAIIEIRCETDFVATNDVFRDFANSIARQVVETNETDPARLLATQAAFAGGQLVQAMVEDMFGRLGEKIEIARADTLEGICGTYIHHNGQVGALVATDKPVDISRQVAMHVAARQNEFWMTRDEVPAKLVEEERVKATESIQGKPANIVEQIVKGKMDKWFSELVLPEQPFALDDKKSVSQAAGEAGAKVIGFRRMEVGRVS